MGHGPSKPPMTLQGEDAPTHHPDGGPKSDCPTTGAITLPTVFCPPMTRCFSILSQASFRPSLHHARSGVRRVWLRAAAANAKGAREYSENQKIARREPNLDLKIGPKEKCT